MSLASLGDVSATRVRVHVPAWGRWWADVDLTDEETLEGAQTLTIADVNAACTIVSGGSHAGRSAYRVVGGVGGWGRTIPKASYMNDLGIKASKVIGDAAAVVGEKVGALPSTLLGQHFVRAAGPAAALLNALAPRAWWVDFDGVTQFGSRPTTEYAGDGVRTRVAPGADVIEVSAEEIAALVPGVTIDGSAPATDVEYILDAARLTVRAYVGATSNTLTDAFRDMLDAIDPWRRYRGTFEFRVVTQDGERLNLQPVRVATGLPDLARVPVRLAPGQKVAHALGSLVLVSFIDCDPSRPCVIAGEDPGGPGWLPTEIELGGPLTAAVLTENTVITAPNGPCTITNASTLVKAATLPIPSP